MRSDPSRLPIRFDAERLAAFCREKRIARLSVFGSVVRDDFDPATSDVDVLADFKPGATRGVGFRFFGYGDELGAILGRKVDFCAKLDSHVEPIVRREAVTIYEDPSEPTKLLETSDCHDLTAAASSSLDFWDNPLDDEWDRQIAADAAAGRLDHLIEEARADVAAGHLIVDPLHSESPGSNRVRHMCDHRACRTACTFVAASRVQEAQEAGMSDDPKAAGSRQPNESVAASVRRRGTSTPDTR